MNHDQNIPDGHNHTIRELQQKADLLLALNDDLEDKIKKLQELNKQLKEKLSTESSNSKENNQEKIILTELINNVTNEVTSLNDSNKSLNDKLNQELRLSKESEQENIILNEISKTEIAKTQAISKKYYLIMAITGIVLAGVFVPYSLFIVSTVGQEYRVEIESQSTGYTIQNLKGDIIDTYLSWRLVPGDTIIVNILNAEQHDPEFIEVIKNTILSDETFEIDNSLLGKGQKGTTSVMYVGWKGAMMAAAETETSLHIPVKFEIIESKTGEGDIIIELTNRRNADGFAGWTNSIADASQNQILKSRITIFAVDSLSKAGLETVVRHEMGHALGLAHSSASEDLMAPTITTNFPYISDCDIDAMVLLYDGGKSSQVICEI